MNDTTKRTQVAGDRGYSQPGGPPFGTAEHALDALSMQIVKVCRYTAGAEHDYCTWADGLCTVPEKKRCRVVVHRDQ